MASQGFQDAAARLMRFLDQDPPNLRLRLDAISALLRTKDFDKARQLASDGLELMPDEPQLRFQRGIIELAAMRPDLARQAFAGLVDDGVRHDAILYNLAYACEAHGDHAAALKALDEIRPKGGSETVKELLKLRARARYAMEDIDGAVADMRAYLESAGDDAEAYGLLSLMLVDADRTDEAEPAAVRALNLEPAEPMARLSLGVIALERQQPQAVIAEVGPLVQKFPYLGRAWSTLAFAYLLMLDLPKAREAFEHAVREMPDHIGTWHGYGWTTLLQSEPALAREAFERAMALDRNFPDSHGSLAVLDALDGRRTEAERGAQRALRLNRESPSGLYAQSLLMAKAGDQTGAQAIVQGILSSTKLATGQSVQDLVRALFAGGASGLGRRQ